MSWPDSAPRAARNRPQIPLTGRCLHRQLRREGPALPLRYTGNTGAFFLTSTFSSGRIEFWGDASPIDDGTGQSGSTLYDGWNDTGATNAPLARNATARLAGASG